ncbi:hypothetical protein V5799_017017, partial [Amblyomma americanum]
MKVFQKVVLITVFVPENCSYIINRVSPRTDGPNEVAKVARLLPEKAEGAVRSHHQSRPPVQLPGVRRYLRYACCFFIVSGILHRDTARPVQGAKEATNDGANGTTPPLRQCTITRRSVWIDCHPEAGADKQACLSRNCCWNPHPSGPVAVYQPCLMPFDSRRYVFWELLYDDHGEYVALGLNDSDAELRGDSKQLKVDFTKVAYHTARLRHLTAFNNILWHAGLYLMEDERDNLGEVSIVMVPEARRVCTCSSADDDSPCHAVELLRHLFTVHSCIVAVEVNYSIANAESLLEALAIMRSLKRLRISGVPCDKPDIIQRLGDLVRSVDFVEELVFLEGYCPLEVQATLPLDLLEQDGIALTTLDVADLEMSAHLVTQLIAALVQNNTVTQLAVGACVFACASAPSSELFARYLAKENATLRKLTLRAPPLSSRPGLETVIRAICNMTTLEELIADWSAEDEIDFELFSEVVAENRSLRTLSLPRMEFCGDTTLTALRAECFAEMICSSRILPWLEALSSNYVIVNLTLDLHWLTPDECRVFFQVVASNPSLQTVTVRYLADDRHLSEICPMIRNYGLEQKVFIQNHHLGLTSVPTISTCPEVTILTLCTKHLFQAEDFSAAFQALSTCTHVTSLSVHCDDYSEIIFSALTAYIEGSSVLKNVELYLPGDLETPYEEIDQKRCRSVSGLVAALSAHVSIRTMVLELPRLHYTDCQMLADAIVQSRCLQKFVLSTVEGAFCKLFLSYLLPTFEENYTLLHLKLDDMGPPNDGMATVQDITRRNASLVNRAARFVMGDHGAYCARSVELVSHHPKLVEVVGSRAGVEEMKAREMIRLALTLPCLKGLNEYMILAGVVRHRVVCQ